MKKVYTLLLSILVFGTTGYGQTELPGTAKLEEKIINLERAGWEAWKNKNAEWFRENTTEEFLSVSSGGISNKSEVIKSTLTDCDVKSVSIDNFKFVMLTENAVLLTYIATQDGACNGKKIAPQVRVSVNYVNRKGKWLEAFYMETPF